MKNLLKLILILIAFQSSSAMASLSLEGDFNAMLDRVQLQLQASNDLAAVIELMNSAAEIAEESKFDRTVKAIELKLDILRKEVITEQSSGWAKISLLGGFLGSGTTNFIDATEIVITNPEAIEEFSVKSRAKYSEVQKSVAAFAKSQKEELLLVKNLTALALDIASRLPERELSVVHQDLMELMQQAINISFSGVLDVSRCVSTDYLKRKEELEGKVSLLFASFSFYTERLIEPLSTKECDDTIKSYRFNEKKLFSARLALSDLRIQDAFRKFELRVLERMPEFYPTWGL